MLSLSDTIPQFFSDTIPQFVTCKCCIYITSDTVYVDMIQYSTMELDKCKIKPWSLSIIQKCELYICTNELSTTHIWKKMFYIKHDHTTQGFYKRNIDAKCMIAPLFVFRSFYFSYKR